MPVQDIQKALEIDPNKTGIEYEDIILCAQKASSATAATAREAFSEHIEDVLVFLAFIEAKDPSFAKKVQNIYVQLYLSSLEFCWEPTFKWMYFTYVTGVLSKGHKQNKLHFLHDWVPTSKAH